METPSTPEPWTLEALAQLCGRVLEASGVGQTSGRVGSHPSTRDIRYYATLGVVDRPSSFQGRVAHYGRRHLLQLVALKRLQATGLTLAEVQARLLGLPNRALEPLAQLPEPLPAVPSRDAVGAASIGAARPALPGAPIGGVTPATSEGPRAREAFWKRAGAPATALQPSASQPPAAPLPVPSPPRSLQELVLAPGVRLQLEGRVALGPSEVERLETAARPLIVLLHQLAAPDQEMP